MTMPDATVTIECLEIGAIPSNLATTGGTLYAVVLVDGRRTGRSRPITGDALDLTAEGVPWRFEVRVHAGDDVDVRLEIHEDRGDKAPSGDLASVDTRVADPWTPGERTAGAGPELRFRVDTQRITRAVPVPARRVPQGASGPSATVRSRRAFIVDIVRIDGLYRPKDPAPDTGERAERVDGYVSEDGRGRIFVNRDHTGAWTKDTQYIDLTARVTATSGASIPSGTKLRWTVIDPDDPFNDDPECHAEWGRYIDENDYSGDDPAGAHAGDNPLAHSPGNSSLSKVLDKNPPWEKAPGGPAPTNATATGATSDLAPGKASNTFTTSVRLHCPNVGGANLRVRATLDPAPPQPVHGAETGLMTMWKRIDVEVVRMDGAFPLDGALPDIPQYLEPACVQLDMHIERDLPAALSHKHMTGVNGDLTGATRTWIETSGVFTHKDDSGWFFLAAAMVSEELPPGASGGKLLDRKGGFSFGRSGPFQTVTLPGDLSTADRVVFVWDDPTHGTQQVGFSVRGSPGFDSADNETTVQLWGHDARNRFTGHDSDGSLATAGDPLIFYPKAQLDRAGNFVGGASGYDVPADARVVVREAGAFTTAGISPFAPNKTTGTGKHFAGRTVLFTHHGAFSRKDPKDKTGKTLIPEADFDAEVVQTVVHEFTHAFGMPHKCGFFDWRTPREKTCAMNYSPNWMVDDSDNLIPGTNRKTGNHLCGRHLMEVRRVHLEDNPALDW